MGAWQNGVRFCDLGICVRIEKDGCDDVVRKSVLRKVGSRTATIGFSAAFWGNNKLRG